MDKERTGAVGGAAISLETIGFITFIVFLVLKLCNQNNPDFAWLSWFWVWFPLWAPIALDLIIFGIAILVVVILAVI